VTGCQQSLTWCAEALFMVIFFSDSERIGDMEESEEGSNSLRTSLPHFLTAPSSSMSNVVALSG